MLTDHFKDFLVWLFWCQFQDFSLLQCVKIHGLKTVHVESSALCLKLPKAESSWVTFKPFQQEKRHKYTGDAVCSGAYLGVSPCLCHHRPYSWLESIWMRHAWNSRHKLMGESHYSIKLYGRRGGGVFFIWVISVAPGYLNLTTPSFVWIVKEQFWDQYGIKNDLYYERGKWENFTVTVKEESHIPWVCQCSQWIKKQAVCPWFQLIHIQLITHSS